MKHMIRIADATGASGAFNAYSAGGPAAPIELCTLESLNCGDTDVAVHHRPGRRQAVRLLPT